jgi:type IV secretion system protein VirB4
MTETRYCLGIASLSVMLAKHLGENVRTSEPSTTRWFLPNREATEAAYIDKLGLTPAEFELQRKYSRLIQRDVEREPACDPGQNPLDPAAVKGFLAVLSTAIEIVDLLDEARAQAGDNPDDWLPVFYKGVRDRNASNPRTPAA